MRRAVTVTVAEDERGAIEDVAERLALAGLDVESVLAALGVVTGSIEESQLASIAAVPGVAAVQQQTSFQIAPPDADVQ